jgi:hypothetical protein
VGYRELLSSNDYAEGLQKAQVRDVDLYNVPAELSALKSAGRPVIAVLAQGSFWATTAIEHNKKTDQDETVIKFHSSFGNIAADPGGYVSQVFAQLNGLNVWGKAKAPQIGGLILSGHSGGGASALSSAKAQDKAAQTPAAAGAAPVPVVKDLVLFDAIHGGQAAGINSFLEGHIKEDAARLRAKRPLTGFRFRGLYHMEDGDDDTATTCKSYYCSMYGELRKLLEQTLANETSGLPQKAADQLTANYQIRGIQVPGNASERHERLVGASTKWGTD